MIVGVADTHAALWYLFNDQRLSARAGTFMDGASATENQVGVSAVSLAEVVYLVEKRRLPSSAYNTLYNAMNDPESFLVEVVFTTAIVEVMWRVPRDAVPDMPDRMITATAISLDVPLISRDRKIVAASVATVW